MTLQQWTHLSNIIHCYDEYSQYFTAEQFRADQTKLPMKKRFQTQSVHQLMHTLTAGSRCLYEKNGDFHSLSNNDSHHLLQKTIKQVCGLGAAWMIFSSHLFQYESFYQTVDMIYDQGTAANSAAASYHLFPDMVFIKLILSIMMFSTFDYSSYTKESPIILHDIQRILHIQNQYIELTWKYLLYKYDHKQAVRCFSKLIRSLFALNRAVNTASEVESYQQMIDRLVDKTNQTLVISE